MPLSLAHRAARGAVVALACGLIAMPAAVAVVSGSPRTGRIAVFSALTLAVMLAGTIVLERSGLLTAQPARRLDWRPLLFIGLLSVPWAMVIVDSPHATYFLLALVVMAQWLLPPVPGGVLALALTGFTIAGQVFHHGMSPGTLAGPIVVLVVVVSFMHVLRALLAESREKSALVEQLRETQAQLAAKEREAGRLAERTRLGRELHDTVAQSLASIQVHLRLADDAAGPEDQTRALAHVRAARDAAAHSLDETRRVIGALTPRDLAGRSLPAALTRVVERAGGRGTACHLEIVGRPRALPMPVETSLVRITQACLGNTLAHAGARTCEVRLIFDGADEPAPGPAPELGEGTVPGLSEVRLEIADDGVGFDVDAALSAPPRSTGGFGLTSMRSRAADLGGYAAVVSAPGQGTLVSVTLPVPAAPVRGEAAA